MAPVQGVGKLIVADLLTDISYTLFEPVVNATVPVGGIPAGLSLVAVWDDSMYLGAQVLVGVLGGDLEVVVLTAVNPGVSFTATFVNAHPAGEPIYGPTFPVQSVAGDPFWEQEEMLQYISTALNEFLLRVPLAYKIASPITVPFTHAFTPLPADCMMPVRVAPFVTVSADGFGDGGFGDGGFGGDDVVVFAYPLRETSQSNLDGTDYRWQQEAAALPYVYYRDKIPLQNVGIWPRSNNNVDLEIIYANRSAEILGMADGFCIPDPFLPIIKAHALEFCYSKDSEQRSPGMAKFWSGRYESGVKIAKMILDVINDTSLQMQ